ncbi:zf-C3HC4-domain-containing protein [Panus rudis PR-1116 ss-1]|nr:zf-C3HC4-domain-containing protein [Panus rudis PR-1116 ss-1]
MSDNEHQPPEEKQCRICLDGEDPTLGRLIRPCLCRGSISYVHVKCLQKWRTTSASQSAFYRCPQCGYNYRFARTQVVGIATNPAIVGALSAILFTILVLCSSYITTWILAGDDGYDSYFFITPWTAFHNIVRTAAEIFTDSRLDDKLLTYTTPRKIKTKSGPPGFLKRFVRRFLLGLPVVGAGGLMQLLSSIPMSFHWFRMRSRSSRGNSRDFATLVIVALVIVGAARALYKVYNHTERLVKRVLLRAEEAILEVN